MSENEVLILVNQQNGDPKPIFRKEVHIPGELKLHREAMGFLWTDSNRDSFWLQKRSMNKPEGQFPGYWTLAVTCHVLWRDMGDGDELGYLNAIKREAPEEIKVEVRDLNLHSVAEMKTEKNWSMSGIVVGIADGVPQPDCDEVDEVRKFDRGTVKEVADKLTPNARRCLIILGILAEIPDEEVVK